MSDLLINVFGVLGLECSRLYCHFQLKLPFLNVVYKNETFMLKDVDNKRFFTISNDENSDFLQFCIQSIDGSAIIIDGFNTELNDIDDCIYCVEFESPANLSIDVHQMKKLVGYSSHHEDYVEFFSVLNFESNIDESKLPKPIEFDKSLLKVFSRPNPELLNDWLFCHNHSHHKENVNILSSITENYGPLILDHIEQIVHLLLNESDEILFESVEDKACSLFIKLRQRYFLVCVKIVHFFNVLFFHFRDCYTTFEDSKTENNKQMIRIKLQNSLLVWYKIFVPPDISLKSDRHNHDDDNAILLRKYRMSFTTDWYLITDDLFKSLIDQLKINSIQIKRFSSIKNFIFNSPDDADADDLLHDHCTISFLPSYSVSLK